jgi:hypothetical protein
MLPPAIKGQTLDTEICINTKSEFSSDAVKAQVQEIKYERDKALSSTRSIGTLNDSRPISAVNSVYVPKLPILINNELDDDV